MITTFRASLRPVRWRWFVFGGIVSVVLLGRLLLDLVATSLDSLAFGWGAQRFWTRNSWRSSATCWRAWHR